MKEQTFNLVATCASGLEALVGKELRDLGIECQVENGRARFKGDLQTIATANLWLRTADRIKIVVGEFDAYTFDELVESRLNQSFTACRIVKQLLKKRLWIACVLIIIVPVMCLWLKREHFFR